MIETLAQPVDLVGDCTDAGCVEFARNLHRAVEDPMHYLRTAIMPCPMSLAEWRSMHRTARKRADRCERLGYHFAKIDYSCYEDALFEINTSLATRQGRPMSDSYLRWMARGQLPDYPCVRHKTSTYGVLRGERLCAYLTLHRAGELGLVSMILGHGDFLRDDIMFLLFQGMVEDQTVNGGWLYYNSWTSGQDGLRYYKARVGFAEGDVEWIL